MIGRARDGRDLQANVAQGCSSSSSWARLAIRGMVRGAFPLARADAGVPGRWLALK